MNIFSKLITQHRLLGRYHETIFGCLTKRNMIDCHCHISAQEFDQDRDQLIQYAQKAGVEGIIAVCEFSSDVQPVLDLAQKYKDFIHPCIGIHPVQWGNKTATLKELEEVHPLIEEYKSRLVGIGEVGLDFTPRYITCKEDKEEQRNVFRKQIGIAKQFNIPVNVHSRSAGRPVIDILMEEGADKVVLHAFDGNVKVAMRGVEAGYYFSVPPSIIRSEQKQKLVSKIPLSNLLLETDAPALGPEKMVRNVPSNILISCQEIARIKGFSCDEVIEETTKNAKHLFGLK
ncbi:putative deoxyribonuclease TATDN3 [Clytia hemisphaerica]|uniref:Uncharacterized protein n=1 Tax=Clytia hemisphaerica TaxID=252671 RepID=A0A7M5VG18_9CNID